MPEKEQVPQQAKQRWSADGHLQRIKESDCFRYAIELYFDHKLEGNVDRLLDYCRSIDVGNRLIVKGRPEIERSLEKLGQDIERIAGKAPLSRLFNYHMWVAIRLELCHKRGPCYPPPYASS